MPKVAVTEIYETSRKALTNHGAATWIAEEVAKAVARAEALGNIICGLYYLESYCTQLKSGRVKGDVEPDVQAIRPGFIKSDARYGFAQPAFTRALPMALEAAKTNGTATLAVAHAHTCTSLGYFTEQIAEAGFIAIGFTNASPIVAPPGGKDRVIGTNPISMAVPGEGAPAMQFDFSTSAVALGKITMAKAAGEAIPLGWAVDADGQPTTDPEAALKGSLVSTGGYKGWGFGLMGEVMAAALTGSVNSLDVGGLKLPDGPPHGLGQTYVILDPSVSPDFGARMARVIDAVEAQEGARIPGAHRTAMTHVDVPDALWDLTLRLSA
ncbi:Ldh family oxidoreductase [Cognatishimia sp. MH4019]|uniref:Ldh family oxidoreductase n=1 Tax=Cognatishimia sp. MH4019 TaxID=2854030 RepID=UPI001CD60881|nr:Ldh family oxidoreductase [Cognatishimia sp. MH4019]